MRDEREKTYDSDDFLGDVVVGILGAQAIELDGGTNELLEKSKD